MSPEVDVLLCHLFEFIQNRIKPNRWWLVFLEDNPMTQMVDLNVTPETLDDF